MASSSNQGTESYIVQLNDQVQEKRYKLKELESEWDENDLQGKKRNIEQSLLDLYPEVYSRLARIKEIKLETEAIEAEIERREDEIVKLSSDIGKQPKLAPRRSYIEQINEITKNSRKQDTDIQLILKDTRELQLESNTIQERLNRTFAILEETILRSKYYEMLAFPSSTKLKILGIILFIHVYLFRIVGGILLPRFIFQFTEKKSFINREAKKDAVAQNAHTLLTSIHETFEQITENILATDRSRRNIADYEAKLANYDSRSLNMDRLRVDLDALRKVNDLLEQQLHST